MKIPSPRLACFCVFTAVSQWCSPREALAQDVPDTLAAERPAIHFQVLKSWKADLGDHAIYLNRVAPPVLPPVPVAIPQANLQASGVGLQNDLAEAKGSELLFLSASVWDHRVTQIRWMEEGRQCSAFSNIDFNLLAGPVAFETSDTVYSLLLAVTNETTDARPATPPDGPSDANPRQSARLVKALEQLSPAHAQYLYLVDEAGNAPQEKELAALDSLHLYFEANRQRLADEYAKREAARLAEEQRPKVPPPPKPDTVVNFWPGPGTVILDVNRKEARP